MQARVARVAFAIGLFLFFVGLACDMLTTEGLLGLPPKAANLFQPVWISGVLFALVGLLPSSRRGIAARASTC